MTTLREIKSSMTIQIMWKHNKHLIKRLHENISPMIHIQIGFVYFYEYVQNCDDACRIKSILHIAIVNHSYLIVSHDHNDIGCTTKYQLKEKTDFKRFRFKAVFRQYNYVLIVPKGQYFWFVTDSKAFK